MLCLSILIIIKINNIIIIIVDSDVLLDLHFPFALYKKMQGEKLSEGDGRYMYIYRERCSEPASVSSTSSESNILVAVVVVLRS